MRPIPRAKAIDATLPLYFGDGYEYIRKQARALGSDVFRTRALFRSAICLTGEEGAKLFYDPEFFVRKGAAPSRLQKTLLGKGSVHAMDGDAQRHRKAMFLSLMTEEETARLSNLAEEEWASAAARWEKKEEIRLFEESQEILCRAICRWTAIPLQEEEAVKRARDLAAMVDAFGAVGPRHWRGRVARFRSEKWIMNLIEAIRAGDVKVPEGSAAYVTAFHRDLEGKLLSAHTAAVELLNVIRPTVAVAYLYAFEAHALHVYPESREDVLRGGEQETEDFVQEVRRFYPFAPVMAAVSRKDIEWRGYLIPEGTLTILDLYGTNHDERSWEKPGEFSPARFRTWNRSPFNFIPQGGGDHAIGHRCPGEWITIELMKVAARFLAREIEYVVPKQDLKIPMNRMPTFPRSRMVLAKVRRKARAGEERRAS